MLILWVLDQLYFENPGAKDSCFDPSTPVLRLGAVVTEVFHCIGLTPSVPGCLELWRGWSHLMATYPYPGVRRAGIRCFLFSGTAWLSSPVQSPLLGWFQTVWFSWYFHPSGYPIYMPNSTCLQLNSRVSCHRLCCFCTGQ